MAQLVDIDFDMTGGYYPSTSNFAPGDVVNSIKAGLNCWVRAGGRVEVGNGSAQLSATNVGARIFSLNTDRAEIAGALVSGRLPNAGMIRYQGGVLFYLSELTSQQVYINETSVSGLTTASSAGILRVAVPDGGGGYNVYDAGFDPPASIGTVTTPGGGSKNMSGRTGVALCAWRTSTNAISGPTAITYDTLTAGDVFNIVLPSAVSGQDGWIMAGTRRGDGSGELRIVRYVYITPRGTFTATNGSPSITAGTGTFFLQDLRPGDVLTISGGSYTVSAVTSNTTLTLTANFAGATASGLTATVTTIQAEWYDAELSDLIEQDCFKPVRAAGVLSYAGRVFLWGTYGETGEVTGPGITPMLANNPEQIGRDTILTEFKDDILNVLPGDETLFVMTPNTLEVVTFTGAQDVPYIIRVLHQPGFAATTCGTVYKNQFYGYINRPVRSVTGADMDVQFGTAVLSDMQSWTASNTVVAADTKNEAVLFCNYDGSSTTTIIPYMVQLGVWSTPFQITGQVTDYTIVNGVTYMIVLTGGNYRVYTWEGGTGPASSYVASQFHSSSERWKAKGYVFTGFASKLWVFVIRPGDASSFSPSSTGNSVEQHNFTNVNYVSHLEIFANLMPARAVALRLDFPANSTVGKCDKLTARGYALEARR